MVSLDWIYHLAEHVFGGGKLKITMLPGNEVSQLLGWWVVAAGDFYKAKAFLIRPRLLLRCLQVHYKVCVQPYSLLVLWLARPTFPLSTLLTN